MTTDEFSQFGVGLSEQQCLILIARAAAEHEFAHGFDGIDQRIERILDLAGITLADAFGELGTSEDEFFIIDELMTDEFRIEDRRHTCHRLL